MMSDHRQARHVGKVAVCVALMIATAGCRQSPFHRRGEDRPTNSDGAPVGYQPPQPWLDQASAARTTTKTRTETKAPEPAVKPVAVATVAARSAPPSPATTPTGEAEPAAPAETPMLDAALRRAEAIEAEHRRMITEALQPKPEVQLATFSTTARKPEPAAAPRRDEAVQRAAGGEPLTVERTKLWNAAADLIDLLPNDLSAAAVPAALPRAVALLAPPPPPDAGNVATEASPPPEPAVAEAEEGRESTGSTPAPDAAPPFGLGEVQLCQSIQGYGAFDPIDPRTLRTGRPVLIYCEPAGLRYEQQGGEYTSRVLMRVELIAEDGTRAWQVDGEAEDRCRRPRHDSFVGIQLNLPDDLSPGGYTIRLTQTDALAQQSAAAEIPVTIGR